MHRAEVTYNSLNQLALNGRGSRDSVIKPISLWQTTGEIPIGERGPGCAVGCVYCNQISMDVVDGMRHAPTLSGMVDAGVSVNTRQYVGAHLDKFADPAKVLDQLRHWPLYTPETPVIFENFNDPGNDWLSLAECAESLVRYGHSAAIVFITKMGMKPAELQALKAAQEKGARLIGIVTYTNMPSAIEGSPSKVRLKTMERLSQAGIPVICSMRPLIRGINDSEENLRLVISQTASFVQHYIAGGLFVFEGDTVTAFEKAGYPLDPAYSEQIYSPEKVMLDRYKERVRALVDEMGVKVVVHNHTSCAVSQIMTDVYHQPTSDRFTHWIQGKGLQFDDDCAHCPQHQKALCERDSQQEVQDVIQRAKNALDRLGYCSLGVEVARSVPNTLLVVNGALTFEELAFIKEQSRWYVDNLPNARGMYERIKEALKDDMHLENWQQQLVGMECINQEWHITIRNSDETLITLMEKWIRSRSRHRAHVIGIS